VSGTTTVRKTDCDPVLRHWLESDGRSVAGFEPMAQTTPVSGRCGTPSQWPVWDTQSVAGVGHPVSGRCGTPSQWPVS